VKHLLTGLTIPRQYVCLPLEDLSEPLSVFLTLHHSPDLFDVTSSHVFLGYKPLIILLKANTIEISESVCLNFVNGSFESNTRWRGFPSDSKSVARLELKKIPVQLAEGFQLFEGVYGEHGFLHPFHQFMNRQREYFRRQNPDNVGLLGNLYDQVRIAYSIPRTIPLITLGDLKHMNMFPTDLHGPAGENFYVSSLRAGGKANTQVEKLGNIAMSFMPTQEYRFVYSLGKNHMQDLRCGDQFITGDKASRKLGIPLPANVLRYLELKRIHSVEVGIHRLHLYEKIHEEELSSGVTLAHIHQYYAQWRVNQRQPTPRLLY
jgi:hypothetical protein